MIEPWLDLRIDQALVQLDLMPPMKAVEQELVAELARLVLEALGQVDRNVGPELPRAHLFGQKAAFEALVVVAAAGGDDLGTEHLEGLRIELALPVHHGAQYGQAAHIAVVENLDDLRPLVAEAEIGLVENEGAAERVERVEDRRDRRRAAREEALVAERADRQERAGLPASVIPSQTQVRQLIEGVIEPGQEDVVRRDVLERLARNRRTGE